MISGTAAVTVEWVLVGLALVFLGLRCDVFVSLAWISFVSCCAGDTELYRLGLFSKKRTYEQTLTNIGPDPATTVEALKMIYATALPYYTELWLIKAALLAFYYELIPSSRQLARIALHIVTSFAVTTYIVVISLNAFYCQPISTNWSLDQNSQCVSSAVLVVFFLSATTNILTDFMIFILPFPLLRNLLISRYQLGGLISIFGLGGIAIIMSIIRVIALVVSAEAAQVAVLTALECSIGIIVACCPALRVLLRRPEDAETTRASINIVQKNLYSMNGMPETVTSNWIEIYGKYDPSNGAAFRFVPGANGRYIMKNVDFEIASERASQTGRPINRRIEDWES